jgi:hypothetical protein
MRNLRAVEEKSVFELAGVAEDATVPHDDILPYERSRADRAVLSDPSRAQKNGSRLDDAPSADPNPGADGGEGRHLSQDGGLQPILQVTSDARQDLPGPGDSKEKRGMFGLAEI